MSNLIFVDCEAYGGSPRTGQLTEFGAVDFKSRRTFHGVIVKSKPDPADPAVPLATEPVDLVHEADVYKKFDKWLSELGGGRPVFVSDNNGFDWQWINDGFHRHLGFNPFGHSSRRISDFWAGLNNDFYNTQRWKGMRKTVHDHNPVNDAMGNVEAFASMLEKFNIGTK